MKFKDLNGEEFECQIYQIGKAQAPLKKDGWNFNWRELVANKKRKFFGLYVQGKLQGLISLEVQVIGAPMMFMHQIEIAPENVGSKGRFKSTAGTLLAYACYQSALHLETSNSYYGYLVFDSKTNLIAQYKKYGALQSAGSKMYFSPAAGKRLMEQYLQDI